MDDAQLAKAASLNQAIVEVPADCDPTLKGLNGLGEASMRAIGLRETLEDFCLIALIA